MHLLSRSLARVKVAVPVLADKFDNNIGFDNSSTSKSAQLVAAPKLSDSMSASASVSESTGMSTSARGVKRSGPVPSEENSDSDSDSASVSICDNGSGSKYKRMKTVMDKSASSDEYDDNVSDINGDVNEEDSEDDGEEEEDDESNEHEESDDNNNDSENEVEKEDKCDAAAVVDDNSDHDNESKSGTETATDSRSVGNSTNAAHSYNYSNMSHSATEYQSRSQSQSRSTKQQSSSVAKPKPFVLSPTSRQRLNNREAIIVLSELMRPAEMQSAGLGNQISKEFKVYSFLVFECRAKVDLVWFNCLKTIRDYALNKAQRNKFCADLLWAGEFIFHVIVFLFFFLCLLL
jgi:hypothetical protein